MSAALQQKPEIKIKLTVVQGPHAGQVFQLNKERFTIGRGPENDVVLMNDPMVSRTHAQIAIVDRDLEVSNLSQKNAIVADGQSVQKWKIVNNSGFTVGDTEFRVEYDLGQAVVSIPQKKPADILPLKAKPAPAKPAKPAAKAPPKNGVVPKKPNLQPLTPGRPPAGAVPRGQMPVPAGAGAARMMTAAPNQALVPGVPGQRPPAPQFQANTAFAQARPAAPAPPGNSLLSNPRFKFYLIILLIAGGGYYYLFGMGTKKAPAKPASTLKYEDNVKMAMNSQQQKTQDALLEQKVRERNTLQAQRVEENLMKGMRDFQLGNYTRAQEFFQLVLNMEPDNQLARRHMYLSKVRFDEIVQEKLMLGESYFKKHNFRMCESLYRQVAVMLQGKSNDQKLLLAEKKAKECQLADEGIR